MIVIVDQSKVVERLGAFPLPVEIVPFGFEMTVRQFGRLGCTPTLRMNGNERYRTDNGNYIADCAFGSIAEPELLAVRINSIPGAVENGLFVNMTHTVIVGCDNGSVTELTKAE